MRSFLMIACLLSINSVAFGQPPRNDEYEKKATRTETATALHTKLGLATLGGKWYFAGPFDNTDKVGFETEYLPEKRFDLKEQFIGKRDARFGWKEEPIPLGPKIDLHKLYRGSRNDVVVYLAHEFESAKAFKWPISLGADDTVGVIFNGKQILLEDFARAAEPDQFRPVLEVKAGKNVLVLKLIQYGGQFELYLRPELGDAVTEAYRKRLDRDFPPNQVVQSAASAANQESKYYRVSTVPTPTDCVLEVGGLGFRPDGKLLACTRRGEVWLVHNPAEPDAAKIHMTRFATGLHESLGLWVQDDSTVFVVQRPEITKLVDTNHDGIADEYLNFSDTWGVSGDYHEFAFGPARDAKGNFFLTLNVGFGGGHQAKAAWRGWCVKIDGKTGELEPWAYGLRSPNGVNFSPEGELFYCDNQGEWVASNKMHHIKKGKFYGHQAGLKWVKESPFAKSVSDKVPFGMMYDGQAAPGREKPTGLPAIDPPCIWFPYGRMGQSVSEPRWDTTAGKFGPFAGQCFVGDQTRSMVMRVALEETGGVWQGACFPFRSGLQCGVNRLAFGPDGGLYVGQTSRGWGSVGGKPYGLQRIHFTGEVPFEVHTLKVTPTGFELNFTKPLDAATAEVVKNYAVSSFTYVYKGDYGCPETDTRAEKTTAAKLSADQKTVTITVPERRIGRVYEFRLGGIKDSEGQELLHPEAYYTLNAIPK